MIDLETVTIDELMDKLYELAHLCYQRDKEFAVAEEEYQILDDAAKPFKSVKMDSYEVKTTAEKERMFYASIDYVQWLHGYQAARSKARMARVEKDNAQRLHDTCRSILSAKNKEWSRQS